MLKYPHSNKQKADYVQLYWILPCRTGLMVSIKSFSMFRAMLVECHSSHSGVLFAGCLLLPKCLACSLAFAMQAASCVLDSVQPVHLWLWEEGILPLEGRYLWFHRKKLVLASDNKVSCATKQYKLT